MSVKGLVIIEIAQLARLGDTFTTSESLVAIEFETVIHVVKESHEEQ